MGEFEGFGFLKVRELLDLPAFQLITYGQVS
jgi:hypothetical protein